MLCPQFPTLDPEALFVLLPLKIFLGNSSLNTKDGVREVRGETETGDHPGPVDAKSQRLCEEQRYYEYETQRKQSFILFQKLRPRLSTVSSV
jgi:hypothetical protein